MADPIIGRISVGDGATFTPAVSDGGVLSWTNNKNLDNPDSVDLAQATLDKGTGVIAPVNSPALTGTPTAPTPSTNDNSTKVATTAFVRDYAVANVPLLGYTDAGVIRLNSSNDLDNVTTNGTYVWAANYTSGAPANRPCEYGKMVVQDAVGTVSCYQTVINGSNGVIYTRIQSSTGGAWSAWKQTALAEDVLPLSGGTMTGDLEIKKSAPATSLTNNDFASRGSTVSANTSIGSVSFNAGNGGIVGRISSYVYASDQDSRLVFTVAKNESTASTFSWVLLNPTSGDRAFYPLTNNASTLGIPDYTWKHLYCGGATMSNQVTITGVNPASYPAGAIRVRYTGITDGTSPSANRGGALLRVSDANGAYLGSIYRTIYANGRSTMGMYNSWNGVTKGFSIMIYGSVYHVSPDDGDDNLISLGYSSQRWKQLYAGTATISTSDERVKDDIEDIPDTVLDAWGDVNWKQFRFKDSVAEKGDKARIHTGAVAQRILSVFEAHGLDACRYGLLCHDAWDAQEEERDEDGNVVQEARPAGDLYSLRYEEALCLEAAYQRRRADRLEERIARLEAMVK